MTGAGLPDLVAQAFEAASHPDGMTSFLAGTAEFFGAQQGAILVTPTHDISAEIQSVSYGITQQHLQDWLSTRDEPDSVFARLARLSPGDALLDTGSHHDSQHQSMHLLGGIASNDEQNCCCMVLWREASHPPFSEPEGETLRTLMSYFRRAIAVNTRFINISTEHQNAVSVLDQAPRAVIILGQNGQSTYQNMEATRVLNKCDGLAVHNSKIVIDDDDARAKIFTFLEQIHTTKPNQFNTHRLITLIPRKSGGAPYKLIMYTLPTLHSPSILNSVHGVAVLLIYDPETLIDLSTSLLHNFYNLTRAETALAQSMFMGNSLPEASKQLGVSINTTRTQLRSIFKKVGVHSQAALLQEFAKSDI